MAPRTIVSYDDTQNDHDALALARVLADAGAELTLAYVRHTTEPQRAREELEAHQATSLLERGAGLLGDQRVETEIVVSGSTAEGLRRLAEEQEADVLVFGSDYRTAAGHVSPQRSAQALLEGGPVAIAIAPSTYHATGTPKIATIGILAAPGDDAALETARALADHFGAKLTRDEHSVDLLVVGSRMEAPHGRVMITSQAQNQIENSTCPVLVVPRGVTIEFRENLAQAA
jgi:nucleotide-binding universal stress UspA family protein